MIKAIKNFKFIFSKEIETMEFKLMGGRLEKHKPIKKLVKKP